MEQLDVVLAELAQQFGTTVPYLWEVMIRQARVQAIAWLVQAVILTVITVVFARYLPTLKERSNGYGDDSAAYFTVMLVGTVLIALTWVLVFLGLGNLTTMIFNPEYWALEQILQAMSQ